MPGLGFAARPRKPHFGRRSQPDLCLLVTPRPIGTGSPSRPERAGERGILVRALHTDTSMRRGRRGGSLDCRCIAVAGNANAVAYHPDRRGLDRSGGITEVIHPGPSGE